MPVLSHGLRHLLLCLRDVDVHGYAVLPRRLRHLPQEVIRARIRRVRPQHRVDAVAMLRPRLLREVQRPAQEEWAVLGPDDYGHRREWRP